MIEIKRIDSSTDTVLEKLIGLYEKAFPPVERRSIESLKEYVDHKETMFFCAVYESGELAGFVTYWLFTGFVYLEHIAVFPEMRNKDIGKQILDFLEANYPGVRLLEVEPNTSELNERRINFYKRNGYEVLDKDYLQPPYPGYGGEGIPLWIMGNQNADPKDKFAEFIRTIKEEVYSYGR